MTVSINSLTGKGALVIDYTGQAAVGNQGNILNPEGVTLLITNTYAYCVTAATAAATLAMGVAATGVSNSDCHAALTLDAVAETAWMGYHPAVTQDAALTAPALWTATTYLTFTTAAQSALPAVWKFYVEYIRVA